MKKAFILLCALVSVAGCGSARDDHDAAYEAQLAANAAVPSGRPSGTLAGTFKWGYFYTVDENDYSGTKQAVIQRRDMSIISLAKDDFVADLLKQGTGYLEDGRIVNRDPQCGSGMGNACFVELDQEAYPFGMGALNNALLPYRTVAANPGEFAVGTKLYIPLLVGKTMPGMGFTHDGCVVVGGILTGATGKLDLFALMKSYAVAVDDRLGRPEELDVYRDSPDCD